MASDLTASDAFRGAGLERLREWFDVAPDALCVHDAEGRIVEVNRSACAYVGYTREELLRLRVEDVEVGLSPAELAALWHGLEEGAPGVAEGRLRRRDGSTFPVELHVAPVATAGPRLFLAAARNISEPRRVEDVLRARERSSQSLLRLSRALDRARTHSEVVALARDEVRSTIGYRNLWVYLFTPDRRRATAVVAGGPKSVEIMTDEAVTTLTIEGDRLLEAISTARDIIVIEDARTDERTDKEVVARLGNRTIVHVPIMLANRRLGSVATGTFGDEGVRVPGPGERDYLTALAGMLAGTLDRLALQERQARAEATQRRLHRELRAVGACHQALLRATDERGLLEAVCRIVCEQAGYRMAWVGYVEHDAAKALRPAAWAGFEDGYISSARLTWSDADERGRGPSGLAVRSGETVFVQDFLTDPRVAPWRDAAARRGYRASIALPLKDASARVFGLLQIYASEPNVMTSVEVRLLQGLAADLAFGVTLLRARAEHERAVEALRAGEEQLRRLNRELRAVSTCNEVLLRATDEHELLEEICRIACEEGGYRMAWAGYAENDPGRSVRMVARAGAHGGYIERAGISWGDNERGRGPTGTALRTGVTTYIEDFETDPSVARWRDLAREHGFRSSVALPLRDPGGTPFGALTIYSAETHAFSPEEVRLLEELAGDLEYGINTLRMRAERDRATQAVMLLSFAMDRVRESVCLLDERGRVRFANEECARVLGYTRDELLALSVADFDPDFPVERWPEHWRELRERGSLHFETRHRTRDGRVFPVAVTANYFEYAGEAFNLALGRDITAQKQAEAARRANLRFFEGMDRMHRAMQGTAGRDRTLDDVLDVVLDVLGCDRAWLIHPLDPEAATWTVVRRRFRPEHPFPFAEGARPMRPQSRDRMRAMLAADGPVAFGHGGELPVSEEASGELGVKSMLSMALRPHFGEPWAFGVHQCTYERDWSPEDLQLFREIGRRLTDFLGVLMTHEAVRASEARYRLVFENSPAAVWEEDWTRVKAIFDALRTDGVVDLEAHFDAHPETLHACAEGVRIVDVNQAALTMHGAADKGALLAGLAATFTPESFATFRQELVCLWNGGTEMSSDAVVRTLQGEPRDVTLGLTVCRGAETTLEKVVVSIVDVTERRRAEEEQRRLRAQLTQSQKMEAIGQLAGGVAHDFNNLLTVFTGYAELLSESVEDPRLKEYANAIVETSRKAAGLTQSLLAFSRKQPMEVRRVDLNDMVRKVGQMLLRIIGEDIELRVECAPRGLPVMADPGQVEQLLVNLATNARDAMPQGGRLVLATDEVTLDGAAVAAGEGVVPGPHARILVSDTGSGMTPEVLERIFEPFFTTKVVGKGTGLGLSIAYGIARQHEGTLRVRSEPGQGTTFTVLLPLATPAPEQVALLLPDVAAGGRETLLVVEDDAALRSLVRAMLQRVGYRVLTATDGEDALEVFERHRDEIALVLTDVIMPRRNGKEVADRIQALRPGLPVLLMSGYTSDIIALRGLVAEGLHLVRKPLDFDALKRTIRGLIDAAGGTGSRAAAPPPA